MRNARDSILMILLAIAGVAAVLGLMYMSAANKARFYQDNGVDITVWEVMAGFDKNIRVISR